MKPIRVLYAVRFSIITALFAAAGVPLVAFSILEFVHAIDPGDRPNRRAERQGRPRWAADNDGSRAA